MTVRLFLLFLCFCSVLTVGVCLQVSDRQSYLVVSLVLCLLLGLLLCLQCCRRPSSSPNTNNGTLPKSNHYPSPKRFVVDPHTYQQDVFVPLHLFYGHSFLILEHQLVTLVVVCLFNSVTCLRFVIVFLCRCFSSYDDMNLKRRMKCPLIRSKSFHLCSAEGKKQFCSSAVIDTVPVQLLWL